MVSSLRSGAGSLLPQARRIFAIAQLALLALAVSARADGESQRMGMPDVPADAEVHVVGVHEPSIVGFSLEEVTNWPDLATKIKEASVKMAPGPPLRTWERLSPHARRVMEDADKPAMLTKGPRGLPGNAHEVFLQDRREVRNAFRALIEDDTFFSPKDFAGLKLTDPADELIKKGPNRSKLDTVLLNRLALRAAFPKEMRAEPVDPTAVEVEVTGKRPVVLVLSACNGCRWVIRPAKQTKVVWVIVSAYYLQEVNGVACPITVLGRKSRSGDYYSGTAYLHEQLSPKYKVLEDQIEQLTGKKFVSFQGAHTYSAKPFAVRSGGD